MFHRQPPWPPSRHRVFHHRLPRHRHLFLFRTSPERSSFASASPLRIAPWPAPFSRSWPNSSRSHLSLFIAGCFLSFLACPHPSPPSHPSLFPLAMLMASSLFHSPTSFARLSLPSCHSYFPSCPTPSRLASLCCLLLPFQSAPPSFTLPLSSCRRCFFFFFSSWPPAPPTCCSLLPPFFFSAPALLSLSPLSPPAYALLFLLLSSPRSLSACSPSRLARFALGHPCPNYLSLFFFLLSYHAPRFRPELPLISSPSSPHLFSFTPCPHLYHLSPLHTTAHLLPTHHVPVSL